MPRRPPEPSVYVQLGVAVRALELVTEALVTQTQTEHKPVELQILDGIRSLGQTYHQLHEDQQEGYARITAEIAALRAERKADWEEINRQLSGLGARIDRRQHQNDDRADRLAEELDELKAHGSIPDDVRAKLLELEMTMKDVLERLERLEQRPVPVAVPVVVPVAVPPEESHS